MRIRAPDRSLSLDEVKELVVLHKDKGRRIITEMRQLMAHFEKMQEYYEEWESDILTVQKEMEKLKEEHGIEPEQVEEYDAFADIMGDIE